MDQEDKDALGHQALHACIHRGVTRIWTEEAEMFTRPRPFFCHTAVLYYAKPLFHGRIILLYHCYSSIEPNDRHTKKQLHTSQPNPSQMLVIDPVLVVCSMVIHIICYNCGYCLVMGKSRNIMRCPTTINTKKSCWLGPPPPFSGSSPVATTIGLVLKCTIGNATIVTVA